VLRTCYQGSNNIGDKKMIERLVVVAIATAIARAVQNASED